jgi:uncharacterized protein
MSRPLPLRLDPSHLARQGLRLYGTVSLEKMPRIQPATSGCNRCNAKVNLWANMASTGLCTLYGDYTAKLTMVCQRCLELVEIDIKGRLELVIFRLKGDLASLDENCETYLLGEDGKLSTGELIEDELLLSLPYIPMHTDEADCNASMLRVLRVNRTENDTSQERNPFAILGRLKRD